MFLIALQFDFAFLPETRVTVFSIFIFNSSKIDIRKNERIVLYCLRPIWMPIKGMCKGIYIKGMYILLSIEYNCNDPVSQSLQ